MKHLLTIILLCVIDYVTEFKIKLYIQVQNFIINLKGQCHEIFDPWFLSLKHTSWALD
jgi:hypothetical protein